MKAIILAGGTGSRLRPLTCTRPKPMVPILNKPILEHLIQQLKEYHITHIIFSLFYRPEVIRHHFQDGSEWGVKIEYSIEEEPLGTAGAVKLAGEKIDLSENFFVISGDALMDFHLENVLSFHQEKESLVTILLSRVDNPLEFGIVSTDDDGRIEEFLEKPDWGEVFTDTVNTGLYCLNRGVLESIPSRCKYDFSKDLFPHLLKKGHPLYGYISSGYWTDVGNVNQYRQAHYDFLDGKIALPIPGRQLEKDIWIGKNVKISPEAKLKGPLYIGDNVEIRPQVILEEYTIIGDNTFIEEGTSIKKSIVMKNSYLGRKNELRGAIISEHCTLEQECAVFEGGVVSDDCSLGNGCTIKPRCSIWPGKVIDGGIVITENLIWGAEGTRFHFSDYGMTGLANINITPQSMAKFGSAYGTLLKKEDQVYISCDGDRGSELMKSAFISGVLSVGVNVVDLGPNPTPVTRFSIKNNEQAKGGIHFRISPLNPQALEMQIFDQKGANLAQAQRKKLEKLFNRSQFPRVSIAQVGYLQSSNTVVNDYFQGFLDFVDMDAIQKAQLTIVVHSLDEPASPILLPLLEKMGCEIIHHRDRSMKKIFPQEQDHFRSIEEYFPRLCQLTALNGDLGLVVYDGEQFLLVDEKGKALTSQQTMLFLTYLLVKNNPHCRIAAPVNLSRHIEELVKHYHCQLIKTKSNPRAVLETVMENHLDLALTQSRFIFPKFQLGFDAFITIGKLLEYLVKEKKSVSQINTTLPEPNLTMTSISCSWELKGSLMRKIIEEKEGKKEVDLTDGIKIWEQDGWVLILPDSFAPQINIYVEGINTSVLDDLINRYSHLIQEKIQCLKKEKEVEEIAESPMA